MPQLVKSNWRLNRYKQPCVICGADHPTWAHGKSPEQIENYIKGRERNPNDPWYKGGTVSGRSSTDLKGFNLIEIERK